MGVSSQDNNIKIWNEYEMLFADFGESAEFYMSLHMVFIATVVLKFKGFEMNRPVALIIDDGDCLKRLMKLFRTFDDSKNLPLILRSRQLTMALRETHSQVVFLSANNVMHCSEKIIEVVELVKFNMIAPCSPNRCFVFVFEQMMPKEYQGVLENFVVPSIKRVDIDETQHVEAFVQMVAKLIEKLMPLIERELVKFKHSNYYAQLRSSTKVIFAGYCIRKVIGETLFGINASEAMLQGRAERILSYSQVCLEFGDNAGVSDVFRNEIYKWQKQKQFYRIKNIKVAVDKENVDEYIYFDDDYYFISDRLFREVCERIRKIFSHIQIKMALWEDGVLDTNSCEKNNFTTKVFIKKTDGSSSRHRVLKLRREYIDVVGELDLLTLCEQLKERLL